MRRSAARMSSDRRSRRLGTEWQRMIARADRARLTPPPASRPGPGRRPRSPPGSPRPPCRANGAVGRGTPARARAARRGSAGAPSAPPPVQPLQEAPVPRGLLEARRHRVGDDAEGPQMRRRRLQVHRGDHPRAPLALRRRRAGPGTAGSASRPSTASRPSPRPYGFSPNSRVSSSAPAPWPIPSGVAVGCRPSRTFSGERGSWIPGVSFPVRRMRPPPRRRRP